jgi:N-acyl-D-aspartate/D-glutamate deacylase
MLKDDGRELLLLPFFNYSDGDLGPMLEMIDHERTVLSLGDGGAHCGLICDASLTTFMLSHWVRDRTRGPRIPIQQSVYRMTQHTAQLYGLRDRGVIAQGYKADLNVINPDEIQLHRPEMAYDLPGGARRLLQRANGYYATVVSGEIVMLEGEGTEARPGRLIRGERPTPKP